MTKLIYPSDTSAVIPSDELSIYSQLFIAIQEHLTKCVPELRWVELDLAQDSGSERPKVAFPAVLVSFPNTIFTYEAQSAVLATISIHVRVLEAPFAQSYASAPIEVRRKALEFFDLSHRVASALQGWTPSEELCTPLAIQSSASDRADSTIRIRSMDFASSSELFQ